ncbi:HAMP domain-containing sensor histidine kinase [Mycoplasmatota bacterium WC44]
MRMSFITKIFSGVIALLFFVFIIQFIFQSFIFPIYFLNEVQDNIEDNLNSLIETDKNEFLGKLHQFTENTQTVSTLLSPDDLDTKISSRLNEITINSNGKILKINLPMMFRVNIKEGDEISGTFIETYQKKLLPTSLYLNGEKIYGGMMNGGMMNKKSHYLENLDDEISITGIVTDVNPIVILDQEDITFSQEIVNLSTGNVTKLKEISTGFTYISKNVSGEDINLVYVSNVNTLDGENILLTVYSLNNIVIISKGLSTFNLFTYVSAFIILIGLSLIYIKRVSIPLININETTKKLSNLDFDTTLEKYESDDEIGQLSKSIILLSTNLKTALEDLKERNEQLSIAMDREIERDNLRKDFVAGVSHELKTPLSIIQASSEALSMNMFDTSEEKKEQFDLIKKEIHRSNKLIMEMMEVYKIDKNEYKSDWVTFDLKDTIIKVNESLRRLANAKNITTTLNINTFTITGDINKIEIVISNLYSNAIKYTNSGESIIINLNDDGFEIINTGASIPKESIYNLFEPFYRVDKAKSRKDGSTGLGLYIVKQILDQHDLKYSIINIKKGVKFSIRK